MKLKNISKMTKAVEAEYNIRFKEHTNIKTNPFSRLFRISKNPMRETITIRIPGEGHADYTKIVIVSLTDKTIDIYCEE